MIKFLIFIVLILLFVNKNYGNEKIVHLEILFRHGAKNPSKDDQYIYRNDPYVNYSYTGGWGALTKQGKQEGIALGIHLRQRYNDTLGVHYSENIQKLFTDDYTRVRETALCTMASLWIPTAEDEVVPGLKWQPVSYGYRQYYFDDDTPYYYAVWNNETYKKGLEKYKDTIAFIMEQAGIDYYYQIEYVHSTVTSQIRLGLTQPKWVNDTTYDVMDAVTRYLYTALTYTKELRNVKCDLLHHMIQDMDAFIQKKSKLIANLYGAHIDTIIILQECMHIVDPELIYAPEYAASMAIELHQIESEYFVQLVYQKYVSKKPEILNIANCSSMCPFDKFKQLIYEYNGWE